MTIFFLKALFDLGASSTLVSQLAVRYLKKTITKSTVFFTAAGNFSTHVRCQVKIRSPEFNPTAEIIKTVHVTKTLGNHNLIISRDLLHKLGVDITFSTKAMSCNDVTIYMKPSRCTRKDASHMEEDFFFRQDIPYS